MKLNYITMMVRDLDQALTFYQDLVGLHILKRFNPGPGEIACLANAATETKLELIQFDQVPKVATQGLVMSYLVTGTTLETLRKKAQDMGYQPSEIIDQAPKPAHFTVADPDGVTVEFSVA